MRKLMWFTIGFTAACVIGIYYAAGIWFFLLFIFSLLGTVTTACLKSKNARIAALVVLGCTVGTLWLWNYDSLYLIPARDLDGQSMETTVLVTDFSQSRDNGISVEGQLLRNGKKYRVQMYLHTDAHLSPGDVVTDEFYFRYTADGGSKEPTYHQGKGILLLAYGGENTAISFADGFPGKYFAAELRRSILSLLDKIFPQDVLGFARALLLGDRSKLTYEVDTAFSEAGIAHVIAVSGMHVSILFSLIYLLSGRRKAATAILGFPVLLVFAAVAGFTPSIVRACIMQALMILALLLDKEYDPPTALAFAVLCMLAVNPLCITSVSLQLSVMCMIGIFLFSGRIHDYLLDKKRFGPAKGKSLKSRMIRWFAGTLSVTLGATVMTTPLCAYYFGTVSVVGLVTNLLTLWVISIIFYGIMAACVLSLLWLPLAQAVAFVVSFPMRYVILVARLLSRVPLGVAYVNNPYVIAWLVFAYILISAFMAWKRKRPVLLGVCMALSLLIALGLSWLEPRLDNFRVTVLDVGQGQSILLQYDDKNFLVDCGGDGASQAADTAAAELLSQGIRRLDGLIITHFDADHAAGAELLLSRIPADAIYLPNAEPEHRIRNTLEDKYGNQIEWLDFGEVLTTDSYPLTIVAAESESAGNDSSLCVLFQPDNYDILITGDRDLAGEKELLSQISIPELELLVVGHHGSASSTGYELLQATSPAVAVISVGEGNSYGHPDKAVLDRLQVAGCTVWRTDQDGKMTFRG